MIQRPFIGAKDDLSGQAGKNIRGFQFSLAVLLLMGLVVTVTFNDIIKLIF